MWGENIPVERYNEMQRGTKCAQEILRAKDTNWKKKYTVELLDDF